MTFLTDPMGQRRVEPMIGDRTGDVGSDAADLASRFEQRYAELAPAETPEPAADPFKDLLGEPRPKPESRVDAWRARPAPPVPRPAAPSTAPTEDFSLEDAMALLRAHEKHDAPVARDATDVETPREPEPARALEPARSSAATRPRRTALHIAAAAAIALIVGVSGGFLAGQKLEVGGFGEHGAAEAGPAGSPQLRIDYDLDKR